MILRYIDGGLVVVLLVLILLALESLFIERESTAKEFRVPTSVDFSKLNLMDALDLAVLFEVGAYPSLERPNLRLAMKIGSTYHLHDIQGGHWRTLCRALRIDEEETIDRIGGRARACRKLLAEATPTE